ncbi:MAG TPA: hypothetical protein VLD38_03815, partial [Nitrosopumilaceae archaeon]|nr:hypothetical protein [Nitrosopumilaceae archaeon]
LKNETGRPLISGTFYVYDDEKLARAHVKPAIFKRLEKAKGGGEKAEGAATEATPAETKAEPEKKEEKKEAPVEKKEKKKEDTK